MSAHPAWTVVVPVKTLSAAKSRLPGGAPANAPLAAAFLRDALAAIRATEPVQEILLASSDPEVASLGAAVDARTIDDTGHEGINAAARWAAQHRTSTGGVAIIVSDLPCLTPAALSLALMLAAEHRTAFLGDLDGTGTTMWFAAEGTPLRPSFGVRSRAVHLAAGDADLVTLHPSHATALAPARRDVDTDRALESARNLGLGPASRAAMAAART